MQMIHCPECGTESKPGTRFCRQCGREIPAAAPAPPAGQATIAMGAVSPAPKPAAPPPADPMKTIVAGMPAPTGPPAGQATIAMGAVNSPPPPAADPMKTIVAGMPAAPPPSAGQATIAMGAVNSPPPSLAKPSGPPPADPLKTVVAGMPAAPPPTGFPVGAATVVQAAQTSNQSPNYTGEQNYSQSPQYQQPADAPAKKGSKVLIFVLIGVFLLGLLVIGGGLILYLIVGSNSSSSGRPTPPVAGSVEIFDSKLSQIELCGYPALPGETTSFDEANAGTSFSASTKAVRLRLKGNTGASSYQVIWKAGAQKILDQSITPNLNTSTGRVYFLTLYLTSDRALPKGAHTVELKNGDTVAAQARFLIGS